MYRTCQILRTPRSLYQGYTKSQHYRKRIIWDEMVTPEARRRKKRLSVVLLCSTIFGCNTGAGQLNYSEPFTYGAQTRSYPRPTHRILSSVGGTEGWCLWKNRVSSVQFCRHNANCESSSRSGKSSLIMAMFRAVEASLMSGQVFIDGVDTKMISLEKLRDSLRCVATCKYGVAHPNDIAQSSCAKPLYMACVHPPQPRPT
jgi:hypothetical protein